MTLDLHAEPAAADLAVRFDLFDDFFATFEGTAKPIPTLPPFGE